MNDLNQRSALLEQLFHDHYETLCYQSYKIVKDWDLSREVVQGAFMRIWQTDAVWENADGAIAYLSRAVKNASIDDWRKKKRHEDFVDYSVATESLDTVESVEEDHEALVSTKLAHAIDRLPEKMKKIFLLHYQDGLTYKEVAQHLQIPDRTVEYNITTAYKRMKKILEEDDDFMDIYLQGMIAYLCYQLLNQFYT